MDVREKLVELIAQKVCGTWSESCDEWLPHDCGKCYANDCHISEIADHLIINGVTVQEWISVDDRLPEHGDVVVVWHTYMEHPFVCQWDERSDCWIDNKWTFGRKTITHWCYLPQPPKGE